MFFGIYFNNTPGVPVALTGDGAYHHNIYW